VLHVERHGGHAVRVDLLDILGEGEGLW
jgi:hypothetical protein